MITIDYFSDLHINHWLKDNRIEPEIIQYFINQLEGVGKGELLLYAGDFSEYNEDTIDVLKTLSALYDQVFFVLGNHDYYTSSIGSLDRVNLLKEGIRSISNVKLLDRDVVEHEGLTIAGFTNWYSIHFPYMGSYHEVADSVYLRSEAEDLLVNQLHEKDLAFYKSLKEKDVDLVLTHYPPMQPPYSPHSFHPCFTNELPFIIGKHWIFGHQHLQGTFTFGDTHFYSNDMGYPYEKLKLKVKQLQI